MTNRISEKLKMKQNESLKVAFADDDKRRASVFSASEAGSDYFKRTKYNGPLTGKKENKNLSNLLGNI